MLRARLGECVSASVTAQIPSLELQGESPGAAHKWSGTDTPSLLPAEQ